MVGEIADFVAKHKAKLFPEGSSKKTSVSKRPGSVGDLGKSLEKNDPETLKFIKKHDTTIYGDKPEVATKPALDNPINSHMKPETGVYEEKWIQKAIKHPGAEKRAAARAGMSTQAYMRKHAHDSGKSGDRARLGLRLSHMHHEEVEEMEEATSKCPKCGASDCTCQHEECGSGRKLRTAKKLKEETLANYIALDILEARKLARQMLEQEIETRKQAKEVANREYNASRPTKRSFVDKVMGRPEAPEAHVKSFHRNAGIAAAKKFHDLKSEGVDQSVHKVSPGDPDYTHGMHIGLRPKAETQTDHKPVVSSSEKSKKLKKHEVKEGHKDPMPHLDNPSHGSGCIGHEDPRPTIKKPHADPTKIPNTNQVPNSTQPPSGVLDKKKKRVR